MTNDIFIIFIGCETLLLLFFRCRHFLPLATISSSLMFTRATLIISRAAVDYFDYFDATLMFMLYLPFAIIFATMLSPLLYGVPPRRR